MVVTRVPHGFRCVLGTTVLLCIVMLVAVSAARGSGTLHWRMDRNQVDAQIDSWPLFTLLEEIAAATGWQVYAEPDMHHTVATRFEKLATVEALDRLLNGLSYALLPQVDGPPKLIVYRSGVDRATQRIRAKAVGPAAKGQPIPDERIVILKRNAAANVDELARRLGATIVGRVDGLAAYRLRFENARRATEADTRLADDPAVESAETNYSITPPATLQPLAASGQRPRQLTPDISPSADKVIVGLIDTPVQTQDGWLKEFLQPGISVQGEYVSSREPLTHGTAMAQTILDGVARALAERGDTSGKVPLSILPIDVYGPNDVTNMFSVAQGLYEALNRHVNVVNLSLGGDTDSRLLRELIQAAAKRGVVVVAAAGNEPVGTPTYPAADPGVISVTASAANGSVASYANTGRWVDAMAPGENVLHHLDQAWYGTGTSFSTSWVSGWAAGYLASRGANRAAVMRETLGRWGLPQSKR